MQPTAMILREQGWGILRKPVEIWQYFVRQDEIMGKIVQICLRMLDFYEIMEYNLFRIIAPVMTLG